VRYRTPRRLTAAQQVVFLRNSAICAGGGAVRLGRLVWECDARPDPLSRTYSLRIVYQEGGSPKVFVVNPDLTELADGRDIPHVYEQKPTRLCLFLPGTWSSTDQLSETIVPWATVWLHYFEEWLVSNDWKGGGEHPGVNTRRTSTQA
jgi:hypothetical protein